MQQNAFTLLKQALGQKKKFFLERKVNWYLYNNFFLHILQIY